VKTLFLFIQIIESGRMSSSITTETNTDTSTSTIRSGHVSFRIRGGLWSARGGGGGSGDGELLGFVLKCPIDIPRSLAAIATIPTLSIFIRDVIETRGSVRT
jgi:hypothetical protein